MLRCIFKLNFGFKFIYLFIYISIHLSSHSSHTSISPSMSIPHQSHGSSLYMCFLYKLLIYLIPDPFVCVLCLYIYIPNALILLFLFRQNIPGYFFMDDAVAIRNAIQTFVNDYTTHYYASKFKWLFATLFIIFTMFARTIFLIL